MGNTTEIQFGINSYQALSGVASSERLVNFYTEPAPESSPFRGLVIGTSGLKVWKDLSQFEPIYGSIVMSGDLYVVCGLTVYKIDSSKTTTNLGTLGGTPGRVMMTANRTQVTILTSNGDSYYATSSTLTKITDADYQSASSCTTLNHYTIFSKTASDQFFISSLNDTSVYSALNRATAESDNDDLVRVYANNDELWLFGERSTEIWTNTANVLFPFEKLRGAYIEVGCAAKHSVIDDQEGIFWLGDDFSIYQAQTYEAVRISTYPIERAIKGYSDISDAFATFYIENGHRFYCLTFPTANVTWEFDTTTRLWHERESRNPTTKALERWLTNSHSFFNNLNLVGDKNRGIIYELDPDTYSENGEAIIGEIITATVFNNYSEASTSRFALMMDTGVGIDGSGQGDDPEIMLTTSSDGAETWTDEMKQPIGKIGTYEKEVFWSNVGQGRSLIIKLNISDPVKRVFTGAYINQEIGYS